MKQKKSLPIQKDSSPNGLIKLSIIGFVILVLFLVFSKKEAVPKIVPETKEQTSICSSESFPVCGADGKTYTNSCTAEKIANVRVVYVGECHGVNIGSGEGSSLALTGSEENTGSREGSFLTGTQSENNTGSIVSLPSMTVEKDPTIITSSETGGILGSSGTIDSGSSLLDPTLLSYSNSTYHYSFSMPKHSYYQAFGAQNGASHSVGISTGTGVESLLGSEVRVYFYANKIIGNLSASGNTMYTDAVTRTTYLLLDGKDSVMIESTNPEGTLVQTIIRTIHKD